MSTQPNIPTPNTSQLREPTSHEAIFENDVDDDMWERSPAETVHDEDEDIEIIERDPTEVTNMLRKEVRILFKHILLIMKT